MYACFQSEHLQIWHLGDSTLRSVGWATWMLYVAHMCQSFICILHKHILRKSFLFFICSVYITVSCLFQNFCALLLLTLTPSVKNRHRYCCIKGFSSGAPFNCNQPMLLSFSLLCKFDLLTLPSAQKNIGLNFASIFISFVVECLIGPCSDWEVGFPNVYCPWLCTHTVKHVGLLKYCFIHVLNWPKHSFIYSITLYLWKRFNVTEKVRFVCSACGSKQLFHWKR